MGAAGNRHSLKLILRTAWVSLYGFAFFVSTIAFILVSYLDFKKNSEQAMNELVNQSYTIERRVSSELLADRTSVSDAVIVDLTSMFGLRNITFQNQNLCPEVVCSQIEHGMIRVTRKLSVPSQAGNYLSLEKVVETFVESLRFKYFLAVFLPILCLFLLGVWYQHFLLNRNLVSPIQALVGQSYRGEAVPSQWPSELVDLSDKLDLAFRERDQAMIGQMASGVLHDIKTLLHSIGVSSELASEVKLDPSVYQRKLEALHRVCGLQIPKMKAVIETVLDGNRDILVSKVSSSLLNTLASVLESSTELARVRNVVIELASEPFVLEHDSAQLGRALLNIVKNGIEAIDSSRSERVVRISTRQRDDAIEIDIEDSGEGLAIEPGRIFKGLITTKIHGTGLGLLIARKIVEAHGGSIVATQSDALGGAKMVILIPNRSVKSRGRL